MIDVEIHAHWVESTSNRLVRWFGVGSLSFKPPTNVIELIQNLWAAVRYGGAVPAVHPGFTGGHASSPWHEVWV
jgi:hypothetical protein